MGDTVSGGAGGAGFRTGLGGAGGGGRTTTGDGLGGAGAVTGGSGLLKSVQDDVRQAAKSTAARRVALALHRRSDFSILRSREPPQTRPARQK